MSFEVFGGACGPAAGHPVCQSHGSRVFQFIFTSFPRSTPFLSSALRRVSSAFSPVAEGVVDEVKGPVVAGVGRLLPFGEPLHEVDLALVLPRARALPWPPTPGERHVPALVAGVPQCCVVVLQHDLGEDAVAALTVFLQTDKKTTW